MTTDFMGETRLFRSYRGRSSPLYNCSIVEAALASLMTPGIFDPVPIGPPGKESYFLDPSNGCNNPIKVALKEVDDLHKSHTDIAGLASFGSGKLSTLR